MSRSVFVTATGTDVGKTYVSALIIKKMRALGFNTGYYKAALSGADSIKDSDAGFVNIFADIKQDENTLVSYWYKQALSPHLASALEGNLVEMSKVKVDFASVCKNYDYVLVEGSGGIICPIRYDEKEHIFLEDIIKELNLGTIVVSDSGLGSINATVLTVEYLRSKNIEIYGIILNNFTDSLLNRDNKKMIEEILNVKVIATIMPNETELDIDKDVLVDIFREV